LGGKYASFFENWEISNIELNVLKLEFEVNNIMDNKTSHNSLLNLIFIIFKGPFSCPFSPCTYVQAHSSHLLEHD